MPATRHSERVEESLGCAERHCGGRLGLREPELSTPQALSSLVGL